jgi:hypothetical protein
MGSWLGAWSGDNAGPVVGRESNRLLISLTITDGMYPAAAFQSGDFHGTRWYFNMYVANLTRDSRPAIVTAAEGFGSNYTWSLELAEVDWGDPTKQPWASGVQLFSVMILGGAGSQSGVIASAIVTDDVRRIDATREATYDPGGWPYEWSALRSRAIRGDG